MPANGAQVNNASSSQPAGPATLSALKVKVISALKQGNLLLVALVLAGLGGVYLLSLRGGPAAASAQQVEDEMKVDAALTGLKYAPAGGLSSQKSQTIVEMFYHEARQKQVPASSLVTNPFVFKIPGQSAATSLSPDSDQPVRVEPDMSGPSALAAVKGLKLQSVLMGSSDRDHLAMVSNNLLAVGQEINGWTVKKIESQRVTLTWRDQQYVLDMPR